MIGYRMLKGALPTAGMSMKVRNGNGRRQAETDGEVAQMWKLWQPSAVNEGSHRRRTDSRPKQPSFWQPSLSEPSGARDYGSGTRGYKCSAPAQCVSVTSGCSREISRGELECRGACPPTRCNACWRPTHHFAGTYTCTAVSTSTENCRCRSGGENSDPEGR